MGGTNQITRKELNLSCKSTWKLRFQAFLQSVDFSTKATIISWYTVYMIKTAKKIARTNGVKHGIFLVSLFASIGMVLFSHYAYAIGQTSFGGTINFEYSPPFGCNGQYRPFSINAYGNTYSPKGYGEISSSSRHVTGSIKNGVYILGLLDSSPSLNCYSTQSPYRIPITTTIFSYFGTSKLPAFGR